MAVDEVPEFIRRLRERQGKSDAQLPPEHDADLIPEVSTSEYQPTKADLEIDAIVNHPDILDYYRDFCGKMVPTVGSKRENIMISCPNPNHRDDDPSAAINLDKGNGGVFACYGCGIKGGDKFLIAGYYFGYDEYNYQKFFPELKRKIAEHYGYREVKTISGEKYVEKIEEEPAVEQEEAPAIPSTNVVPLFDDLTFEDHLQEADIRIEWEEIIPQDTFMWEWMTTCTIDDLPHEYYFWLGMQAIGFAAGTEQLLYDFQMVKGNLFVCLYGRTGSGKSRCLIPYVQLLESALPYDEDPFAVSTGVKILSSPASAEALLKMFQKEILDPSSMKVLELAQVRGLLRAEEFAGFIARASRATNPMKETLIELYDVLGRDMRHTSIGGGTVVAKEPYCQMVTTTQPAAIHDFLRRTDAHSGFLNRWVFATGLRRRSRISYGGVNIDITKSSNYLRNLRAFCSTPNTMQLSGAALNTWDDFFHKEIVPLHDSTDESMLSRIDLTLKKIILLFTLNEHETAPTQSIVERSLTLYKYLRRTYTMFSSDIAHTAHEECRLAIKEALMRFQEKNGKPATLRELMQRLNNKYDRQLVSQVIKTMLDLDELQEVVQRNDRGPSTKRYKYATT